MGMHHEGFHERDDQSLRSFELPEETKEFLRQTGPEEYVMITGAFEHGVVHIVKTPGADIEGMHANVPMEIIHELHEAPEAPVIRSVVKIYDDLRRPLALEAFTNVRNEEQCQNFATLASQPAYIFLFYDESLQHRLTKFVVNTHGEQTVSLFQNALLASSHIPDEQYNFDQAKEAVIRKNPM